MADIRKPGEEDRQGIVDLARIAFNASAPWFRHLAPRMRLDGFLCAYEGGRVAAMAQAWDLSQWFGGRAQPMAGIAMVASSPERRGAGLAPEVMRALLTQCREKGAILSTLYPSRASVYRRLGYEYAGVLTQYRMPIAELPAVRAEGVEELAEGDLEGVRACYRRYAAQQTGLADSEDEDWWRLRVIRRWNPDVASRAAVVRGPAGIEGYVSFQLDPIPDSWGYRIVCSHLVGQTGAGLTALLGYLRSFRGMGQFLVWYGPPQEPLSLLAGGGGETIQPVRTVRFMTRLLDVGRALAGRGYAEASGSATIRVEDALFPENEGPFRIEAEGGRVQVLRVSGAPGGGASAAGRAAAAAPTVTIPIGAFSALFTGYASAPDLIRAGLVRDDPSLTFLSRLFAGPTPWMTDFF